MNELLSLAVIEAGSIAVLVGLVIEAIKGFGILDTNRWLPSISLLLGVVFGVIYALSTNDNILVYSVAGLVGGGLASGIYDNVQALKGAKIK